MKLTPNNRIKSYSWRVPPWSESNLYPEMHLTTAVCDIEDVIFDFFYLRNGVKRPENTSSWEISSSQSPAGSPK